MRISFANRLHCSYGRAFLLMTMALYGAGMAAPSVLAAAPPAAPPAAPATTPMPPPTATGAPSPSMLPPAPSAIPPAPPGATLPAGPLTLEQAIAIAFANNGNVTIAQQNLVQSRNRVTEARAGTLPNVNGGVSYGGTGVNDIGSIFGNVRHSTTFDRGPQPTVQLKATPFDSGQTRYAVRSAQADVRGATEALNLEHVNLAFTVTNDFYSLLRAQSLAALSVQQVEQANQQLQLVLGKIAAGAEAAVNRYQFDTALANAQVTLLQNQNAVRQDGAALRASLGLPVGPPPVLSDVSLPASSTVLPPPPPLDQALATASSSHPQILEDVAAVDSSRSALRLTALRRRPILTTTATVNVNPNDPRTKSDWTVLAAITMPIWDAGVTRAREREARAGLNLAAARLTQTRIDITNTVQQAVLNIQNAKERLDASRVAADAAARNLEAENARYQQGLAIPVDLTTAQLNSFTAQSNEIQALYDYYIAQAQLKQALGQ
jgi:outer membrane protein